MRSSPFSLMVCLFMLACAFAGRATAAPLPGPADIDRINPTQTIPDMRPMDASAVPAETSLAIAPPPKDAKLIKLFLRTLKIEGSTVYSQEDLRKLYQSKLGQEITLDTVWQVATEITKKYRADGYFLSRAYVPAQEVTDGSVTIRIAEGYIEKVSIDRDLGDDSIVREIIGRITSERPVKIKTLEHEHLLLSDLPGFSLYQGTLAPLKGAPDGAVQLIFSERQDNGTNGAISIDNFGSRYLGPYELSGTWHGSLIPLEETYISGTTSLPTKELGAVNIEQHIQLTPELRMELTAGYTRATPGYLLKIRDIESKAVNAGIAFNYQIIRQRQENLAVKLGIDTRDSESKIIGTELSKDKIRALRLSANYDRSDNWNGYNVANITISQGLSALGASKAGYINLSRDGAKPDFTKAELQYSRYQSINSDLALLLTTAAQRASGSLLSSEEFGFGGQTLGRAYDPSEISGDDGIAAGLELRYLSLPQWQQIKLTPYGFYDVGKVWNRNSGQARTMSAASAGAGIRLQHDKGLSGALQIAMPLTKPADTPLYGSNGRNMQFTFQITYGF